MAMFYFTINGESCCHKDWSNIPVISVIPYSSHFQQSLFPPYQTDFYQGPSSPEHNFAIKKMMIVITMSTIVISGVVLHVYCILKGTIGCKIHFYMVFAYKCVLEVCGHNHPTMKKSPFL